MAIKDDILTKKQAAEDYLRTKRSQWDTYEKLFHNSLADKVSQGQKSQVFDPKISTLITERSFRVMAQLPTGRVKAISKNDNGSSKLMNLLLEKYVFPNANSQYDFLTKLRLMDLYSNIYGNFFGLVDWNVNGNNGYVGPDMWLLNIRDVFPQVGAVSLNDSDYVIVRTWRPLSFFESLRGKKGYKNIDKIITKLEKKTGSKDARDSESTSKREEEEYPQGSSAKGSGYFEVLSHYEKDRWIDFSTEAELEFRDQDNPHDDDTLPVFCKYSLPLLDDFMGMGDMERGESMQQVINSVWNLYLDAVKMSIFPPALINKDNIASMSSIRWGAAAKWLIRGNINNAVSTIPLSPQGIQTFNNTYNVANASLLNLFGTTDTTVTSEVEAGFGKTPKALQMQAARQNSRDVSDRFFMEQFLSGVGKKMVNLLRKKLPSTMAIRLFEEEITQLADEYEEVDEMYNRETGKLNVGKGFGSTTFDYEVVSGSSYAVDQNAQQENLMMFLKMATESPQLLELAKMDGYTVKVGEILKKIIANIGIQDWEKLIEEPEGGKEMQVLEQDKQKFMQALSQIQGINQVPTQPGQMEQQGGGIIG